MEKVLLAIGVLFILSSPSQGKEIQGKMRCEVKTNYVVSIDEGVSKVYSGFEDSFEIGDSLSFEFSLDNKEDVWLKLIDAKGDSINSGHFSEKSLLWDDGVSLKSSYSSNTSAFRRSFINWDLILGRLVLKRYYKSDWSGYLMTHYPPSMSAQIATLDCRQSSDKVDNFISNIRESVE